MEVAEKDRKTNGRIIALWISVITFVIAATLFLTNSIVLIAGFDLGTLAETEVKVIADSLSRMWIYEIVFFLASVISLVLATKNVGQRDENGNLKTNWFDKIFSDVQIAACIAGGFGAFGTMYLGEDVISRTVVSEMWLPKFTKLQLKAYNEWYSWWSGSEFEPLWLEILAYLVLMAGLILVIMMFYLSIVKKLKAGMFWKNTIIGKFVCYLYDCAKKSDDIFWKVMIVCVVACLVAATWIGTVLVLVLIFMFVPKWLKKYKAVKDGVEEVRKGNLEYQIPIEDTSNPGEFDRLAISINEISGATKLAVENEIKNQRLKTDLISNVSHDLKTPLTSMVSYVDLLKKEGLDSENAPEYLNIIDEKTKRLQKLTEDLFEAAKASSGSIPVNIEKIEMSSIVNQALAEAGARLESNGLQVIFTPKTEANYVMADGQQLWRVIENLLVNASKYSLPNSRVYLDIIEKREGFLTLEVKNMSKEPLNISADELMERFTRGDSSRNTEGSGLGLAISKDLTNLMGGEFRLDIDGDLFKASVLLPKA